MPFMETMLTQNQGNKPGAVVQHQQQQGQTEQLWPPEALVSSVLPVRLVCRVPGVAVHQDNMAEVTGVGVSG